MATMLESHTRQIDTASIKRARKNNQEETKQKGRFGTASNEISGGGGLQLVCGLIHLTIGIQERVLVRRGKTSHLDSSH